MRIAFLSRYQNIFKRGAETFVFELSQRLRNNFEVKIFEGSDADSIEKIIKGDFDIVYPINGRMQALQASVGRLFGRYKLIIGGHSGIGKDDLFNIVFCRPDRFVALTQNQLDWANKFGVGLEIVKIPNGVDLKKFNPVGKRYAFDLERPIILSVGALEWYKHHERVIGAVSKLKKGSLAVVGSGPKRSELLKLGKEKLGSRFKLIEVEYPQMPTVYRGCDVFTLPSWEREAFGIVYLEALASNIPVVAPDDSSRREIVGNGGILADLENEDEYVFALKKATGLKWGFAPRIQAEKFSWDKTAEEYIKLFKNL